MFKKMRLSLFLLSTMAFSLYASENLEVTERPKRRGVPYSRPQSNLKFQASALFSDDPKNPRIRRSQAEIEEATQKIKKYIDENPATPKNAITAACAVTETNLKIFFRQNPGYRSSALQQVKIRRITIKLV